MDFKINYWKYCLILALSPHLISSFDLWGSLDDIHASENAVRLPCDSVRHLNLGEKFVFDSTAVFHRPDRSTRNIRRFLRNVEGIQPPWIGRRVGHVPYGQSGHAVFLNPHPPFHQSQPHFGLHEPISFNRQWRNPPEICEWKFTSGNSCKLSMHLIYYRRGDPRCSKQYLLLADNMKEMQICGSVMPPQTFMSEDHRLSIKFFRRPFTYRTVFKGYVTCHDNTRPYPDYEDFYFDEEHQPEVDFDNTDSDENDSLSETNISPTLSDTNSEVSSNKIPDLVEVENSQIIAVLPEPYLDQKADSTTEPFKNSDYETAQEPISSTFSYDDNIIVINSESPEIPLLHLIEYPEDAQYNLEQLPTPEDGQYSTPTPNQIQITNEYLTLNPPGLSIGENNNDTQLNEATSITYAPGTTYKIMEETNSDPDFIDIFYPSFTQSSYVQELSSPQNENFDQDSFKDLRLVNFYETSTPGPEVESNSQVYSSEVEFSYVPPTTPSSTELYDFPDYTTQSYVAATTEKYNSNEPLFPSVETNTRIVTPEQAYTNDIPVELEPLVLPPDFEQVYEPTEKSYQQSLENSYPSSTSAPYANIDNPSVVFNNDVFDPILTFNEAPSIKDNILPDLYLSSTPTTYEKFKYADFEQVYEPTEKSYQQSLENSYPSSTSAPYTNIDNPSIVFNSEAFDPILTFNEAPSSKDNILPDLYLSSTPTTYEKFEYVDSGPSSIYPQSLVAGPSLENEKKYPPITTAEPTQDYYAATERTGTGENERVGEAAGLYLIQNDAEEDVSGRASSKISMGPKGSNLGQNLPTLPPYVIMNAPSQPLQIDPAALYAKIKELQNTRGGTVRLETQSGDGDISSFRTSHQVNTQRIESRVTSHTVSSSSSPIQNKVGRIIYTSK